MGKRTDSSAKVSGFAQPQSALPPGVRDQACAAGGEPIRSPTGTDAHH